MTRPLHRSGKFWLSSLAFVGLALATGPTVAQEAWSDAWNSNMDTQELTITAPYRVEHRQLGRTSSGMPVEEVSISQKVAYGDLDLRSSAGVAELHHRVAIAARQNCHQIDAFYPQTALDPPVGSDSRSCIRQAVDGAHAQVARAVLVARQ